MGKNAAQGRINFSEVNLCLHLETKDDLENVNNPWGQNIISQLNKFLLNYEQQLFIFFVCNLVVRLWPVLELWGSGCHQVAAIDSLQQVLHRQHVSCTYFGSVCNWAVKETAAS